MTKQLPGVDIIKYLMAFCVVAIHFRANYREGGFESYDYPVFFDWLIRLAVPFFFVSSGFLLQRKLDSLNDNIGRHELILKQIRKIFRLWLKWNLIYLPLVCFYFNYYGTPPFQAVLFYMKWLLLNGGVYCAIPLWYLYSLLWVLIIISVTMRFNHYRCILFSVFVLIGIPIWLAGFNDFNYLSKVKLLFGCTMGGGLPILSGMLLYSFRELFKPIYFIILLCLSFVMRCYGNLPFIPQIGAIGLFGLAWFFSINYNGKSFMRLREQSMWIYFTHMIIVAVAFKIINIELMVHSSLLCFCIIEGAAGILGYILYSIHHSRVGAPLGKLL